MSKDLTKQPGLTTPKQQKPVATDPASRLKRGLMEDALGRMFGKDVEKPIAPGAPRLMLTCANHERSPGWDYAKTLQRQIFDAAVGVGLQMKFAASAATMTTACAAFGLQPAGLVTQMKWRASWIGPRAIAAVMSSSAARSSRP